MTDEWELRKLISDGKVILLILMVFEITHSEMVNAPVKKEPPIKYLY